MTGRVLLFVALGFLMTSAYGREDTASRKVAPRAVLECFEGDASARVKELCGKGASVGWLTFCAAGSSRIRTVRIHRQWF